MKMWLFVFLGTFVFCSSTMSAREQNLSQVTTESLSNNADQMKETLASINEFGLNLFGRLKSDKENVFLSPYSIFTAFSIAYAGAKGATALQMEEVLCLSQKNDALHEHMKQVQASIRSIENDGGFILKSANALWADEHYPFLESYREQIKSHYSARITNVDFVQKNDQALNMINNWVEEETNHTIKNILQDLSPRTKLIITNAIYFKAGWDYPFSKERTKEEPFYPASGKKTTVPMMTKQIDDLFYYENSSLQLVRIPYTKKTMEMVVILPKKGMPLERIQNGLDAQKAQSWLDSASKQNVVLSLPRFKMDFSYDLKVTLIAMGMIIPFKPDANFSLMDGVGNLFIDQVQHKAFVEVDEKGTEAAAATVVTMVKLSNNLKKLKLPIPFKADRPFLFVIRDTKLGCFLFLGKVGNPKNG